MPITLFSPAAAAAVTVVVMVLLSMVAGDAATASIPVPASGPYAVPGNDEVSYRSAIVRRQIAHSRAAFACMQVLQPIDSGMALRSRRS